MSSLNRGAQNCTQHSTQSPPRAERPGRPRVCVGCLGMVGSDPEHFETLRCATASTSPSSKVWFMLL
ncbi:hypothetical protein Nmel_001839 [Mimus melanotis]